MTPTAARPTTDQRAHWYWPDARPCFSVPSKGTGEARPTTLRDARELGLLPSVTTILRVLNKPDLNNWIVEQACLAVLTSPRPAEEALDAFVKRVLHEEKHQDQERDAAADLGTRIHAAISAAFTKDNPIDLRLLAYTQPVLEYLSQWKAIVASEMVCVGKGYAGTIDLIAKHPYESELHDLFDFKTTRRLPEKGSYPEHRLQLAAYAQAIDANIEVAHTYNIYISTTEPGRFKVCGNPNWITDFDQGFAPLVEHWQWANNYKPINK